MTEAFEMDARIAVIGMSGRFPGANDIESFWSMICAGGEGMREFDDEELRAHGASEDDLRHPRFVRTGAPLADPDLFDARFFAVTPRDAELMDPQHRVMLEEAHSALENAGYGDSCRRPLTGVFVGSSMSHYAFQIYSQGGARGPMASLPAQMGNGESHLATRLSYKLDLRGPCMFVQTACSTSLTAIHLACRSLLSHECDMALAGGSSLTMPFPAGYVHMEGGMLSVDGRCRSFDASATGTVIGNGAAAVILKRYADAARDGDTVHAVVIGSAINNDGSDKAGYTAPSRDGQIAVIAEALGIAGVPARTIGLVEAHGTGTIIGDPIEIDSLSRAYGSPSGSCWIGSVKSNVGHMLAAAGVAGFIKAVLALQRQAIPPSANYRTPNPHINFPATPFRVADALRAWPTGEDHPRRAAVSSFGIGGSNAHLILEEAPPPPLAALAQEASEDAYAIVPFSAASPQSFTQGLRELARAIPVHPAPFADIAWTLQTGRRAMPMRAAVVARSGIEAAAALELLADVPPPLPIASSRVGFLFPGQGMQRSGMFRELCARPGAFRDHFLVAARIFGEQTGDDLVARVMAADGRDDLQPTAIAQPALFAVEHSLARQWMAWGLSPDMLLGHSIGDFAAAAIAGVMSEEDAMRAVVCRGQLMQAAAPGAMYAVSISEAGAEDFAVDGVVIAAVNAPRRTVLAVAEGGAAALESRLTNAQVTFQRLRVSHAFHSPMMAEAADVLASRLATVELRAPDLPMVSSATGSWLTAEEATDPAFWGGQVVRPVRFLDALRTIGVEAPAVLIETGPGAALANFAASVLPGSTRTVAGDAGPRKQEDSAHYCQVLAAAWTAGAPVDWTCLHGDAARARVPLPTYGFDRQRFWIAEKPGDGPVATVASGTPAASGAARRANDVADWFYVPSWRRTVAARALPQESGDWLIFVDDPIGERLAIRLAALGHSVATVTPGTEWSREDLVFAFRPEAVADYDRLIEALSQVGIAPSHIVHAWGLGDYTDAETEKRRQFDSPLLLAQALGRAGGGAPAALTILAQGVQRVLPGDPVCPERALGIGPAKVISQEFPWLTSRHLDIVSSDWADNPAIDRLIAELAYRTPATAGRPRDQRGIVALRGGDRWIQTFEKAELDPAPAAAPSGVHVVTGGFGGIGAVLAKAIADGGPATIVLTTRGATGDAAASAARERLCARIAALGSTTRVAELDPADPEALAALFVELKHEFGVIDSIVHTAGAPGAGLIQLKSLHTAHAVIRPKYEGTAAIERALEIADVRARLLFHCSSLTSVRGGFGQVDYCAANAFLDAHAQSGGGARIDRVVSANWGAWAETGMAVAAVEKFGFLPCPFWLSAAGEAGPPLEHPLLDRVVTSPEGERAVRLRLDPAVHWVLGEHQLRGRPTMPGTGHVEILRAAYHALFGGDAVTELAEIEFRSPLTVDPNALSELFVLAVPEGDGRRLRIVTRSGRGTGGPEVMVEHVRALARPRSGDVATDTVDVIGLAARLTVDVALVGEGEGEAEGALRFGAHWHIPGRLRSGDGESLVELELPADFAAELDDYGLHPALVDVALGAARLAAGSARPMLPFGYERVAMFCDRLPARIACHAVRRLEAGAKMVCVDATILDESGRPLVAIEGYRLREIEPEFAAKPAAEVAQSQDQVADALAGAILSHEGAQAFLIARAAHEVQLVISPLDLDAVVAKWQADERSVIDRVAGADLARRDIKAIELGDGSVPCGETEVRIAAIWSDLLGYTAVPRDGDFFALGGDSLLGIQLHGRMQEDFAISLTLAAVFENPTVAKLAALVEGALGSGRASAVAVIPAAGVQSIDELLTEFDA